jgi:eukaryotic-like serine/threonine-protein kinase
MDDPDHHESEIFVKAVGLTAEERAAYLAQACGEDIGMLRRLEALLRVHGKIGDFLEAPARDSGVDILVESANEGGERRVGRYRLLEKIGEGGCGEIYLAEQAEPVRRQVALKIIKPGMGTRDVIARFEVERQALALMDHPGIAKVFDAGETDSGRPYFVMELIRGIKITDYCDRNCLPTEERLKLFIQVCEAVQHAHQKGVIHRDLKPSNILVTATLECAAQAVVIDFGIAKATNDLRLTDKTLFTSMEMLIGTPTYMSPEQTAFTSLDVDTRSDIYSLGVLLYELLTGSTPFDAGELLKLGVDEVRRAIREQEPPRPSNRLGKLPKATLADVARHRLAEPRMLMRSLRGDLDWIVMKCLEKDRSRRYATANGLALDIKRHLGHEPVDARPPSAGYLFQKAIRRNKLAYGAATAVLAALVSGTVTSTWQLLQTRKAQRETEAARHNEQRLLRLAQASEKNAQAQALSARRTAYSSDMNAIGQALKENNLRRARELLNRQRPKPDEPDLRDWEWRYLWSQARADAHEVFSAGPRWSTRPLSFSSDGRTLLREFNGRLLVTDVASRRLLLERPNTSLPVFAHRTGRVACVNRAPSGKGDVISILDLGTHEEIPLVRYLNLTQWIGFTPDDRMLLSVSVRPDTVRTEESPAELIAWDAVTGKLLWQRTIGGRPAWMRWRPYAISADGTTLAAALPHGQVQVLDTKDGSERFTIKVTDELPICVQISPDGGTLLTGAGYSDTSIRLWDARNGEPLGTMEGHSAYVTDLQFTPDGSRLISASADQTIRLWAWSDRHPAGVLRAHLDEVEGIAVAPDGGMLASRSRDGSIFLWDLGHRSNSRGYIALSGRLRPGPSTAQFTADSRAVVGLELSGGVAVWDAETGAEVRRLPIVSTNKASGVSPDAKWIITSDDQRRSLSVWDAANGMDRKRLEFNAPQSNWSDWKFINEGSRLVTVSGSPANALLELWDTRSWERLGSRPLHYTTLLDYSTNFAPKSFALPDTYAVMADGVFRLFNIARLDQAPRIFPGGFLGNDWADPSDGRLAAAESSGLIRVWDVATLQPMVSLKSFRLSAHSVTFSPDGKRLAAGSNGEEAVRLWDTETWQEVLTLSGAGSRISGVKFSPDGRHLLAINDAGLAHLWTAPTWEEIAAEEARSEP